MNNGEGASLVSRNGQSADIASMRSKMTHVMEENQLLLRTVSFPTSTDNFTDRTPARGYLAALLHADTYHQPHPSA